MSSERAFFFHPKNVDVKMMLLAGKSARELG